MIFIRADGSHEVLDYEIRHRMPELPARLRKHLHLLGDGGEIPDLLLG